MGLFGNIISALVPAASLGYEIYKDQHLTGAQREANAFSADQASLNRNFQAAQAEISRDWQEKQYNQYNSPAAMVRQYQDAGLNPALMYEHGTSPASVSTSFPSGGSVSSVTPPGGDLVGMIGKLMELSLLSEQKRGLQLENQGKELSNEWDPRLWSFELGVKQSTISKIESEVKSILASTEGQRLANDWNPRLWQNQLDNGRVSRESAIVGIAKTQQEIQNLISEQGLIGAQRALAISEKQLKEYMQALTSAQTALVKSQNTGIIVDNWRNDWEQDFIQEHGFEPNAGMWQLISQTIGKKSSELHNIFKNGFNGSSQGRGHGSR